MGKFFSFLTVEDDYGMVKQYDVLKNKYSILSILLNVLRKLVTSVTTSLDIV